METFFDVLIAYTTEPFFALGFLVYGYVLALFAKRLIQIDKVPLSLRPVTRGDYIVAVVLVAHILHAMLMVAALVVTAGFFLFVLAGFMVVTPVIVLGHALAAFPMPYKYQGMKVQGSMVLYIVALIGFVLWQVTFSAPAAVDTKEDRQDAAMQEAIREGNINFAQTIENIEDRNHFYDMFSYRNNQPEACGYIEGRDVRFDCYDNDPEFRKVQYLCQDYPGLTESDQYYLKSVCRYEQGLFQTYNNQRLRGELFSCQQFQSWYQQSWYQQYRKNPDIGEDQQLLCRNLEIAYNLSQTGNAIYCNKYRDVDYQNELCLGIFTGTDAHTIACAESEDSRSKVRLQCSTDVTLEDGIYYHRQFVKFLTEDFPAK